MKRIAMLLVAAYLLTQSFCYLNQTDNSRIRIPLDPPDPLVTAMHVAVYGGSPDNLLLYQVFSPDEIVDLQVPSGEDRIFVVWAETTPGTAKYYGKSNPIDLGGGEADEVRLQMYLFSGGLAFNAQYNTTTDYATWNVIYGADNYEVLHRTPGIIMYYGPNTTFYTTVAPFSLRAYSSVFNLVSEEDDF